MVYSRNIFPSALLPDEQWTDTLLLHSELPVAIKLHCVMETFIIMAEANRVALPKLSAV